MTEKFFNILAYNVIPVVFNGANMSAIAPPHSYINAEDFSSVDQLAEYLQLVASNDSLFASYFWWRDYYLAVTVGGGEGREGVNECSDCSRMPHTTPTPGVLSANIYTERRVLIKSKISTCKAIILILQQTAERQH